jgi:hypothetical protein
VAIASLRESTFGILLGIILFYAIVMYLNTSMNKINTITSNVRDMIWFFIDMLDIHRASAMISILAPVWCHVHGAIVVKPPVGVKQLTVLTISHHTPPLQNQVRRLYFSFVDFTWFLGLLHKKRFLPTNMKPQC